MPALLIQSPGRRRARPLEQTWTALLQLPSSAPPGWPHICVSLFSSVFVCFRLFSFFLVCSRIFSSVFATVFSLCLEGVRGG